jgi:hypothetical protein
MPYCCPRDRRTSKIYQRPAPQTAAVPQVKAAQLYQASECQIRVTPAAVTCAIIEPTQPPITDRIGLPSLAHMCYDRVQSATVLINQPPPRGSFWPSGQTSSVCVG